MKKHMKALLCLTLCLGLLLSVPGCREEAPVDMEAPVSEAEQDVPQTDAPEADVPETDAPETDAPETETETDPPETEPPETETEPPETEAPETETETAPPETETAAPEAETEAAETEETKTPETEAKAPEPEKTAKPVVRGSGAYHYLTGESCSPEEQKKRPAAVMLNNLRLQLPQFGLDAGQIFFECVTEGSITRLMMLTTDYESLGTTGSIRSSREIFADMAADFDAVYVHAGGSPGAYGVIASRGIDSLDGANMYLPSTYFRDPWRLNNIGYEHSLMTNGAGIVSGIQFKGYRTEYRDVFEPVFSFYDEKTNHIPGGPAAEHVRVYSTPIQAVDFVYDASTGQYLRYHYGGMAHKDGASGAQIAVKNVILLFMDIAVIPGDEASRVAVTDTGTGTGYFITNGQRTDITWSRSGPNDVLRYTLPDGTPLTLNAGKTFVCILDKSVREKVDFNYKW